MRWTRGLGSLVVLVMFGGCARREATRAVVADDTAKVVPAVAVVEPAEPPPLLGAPLEKLELGGETAFVSLPVGARDKRAVIVGVHGAGDRPDWACAEWKAVAADWAFVVCPQATNPHPADKNTFVWGSAAAIAAQADRAVAALRERYGAWMDDGPLVYGGWSQGGTLAASVIETRPGVYDRAVLVEVGHTALDADAVAASFASAGIRRAIVSCESPKCRTFAQTFERAARRRRLPAQTVDIGNRHHWFDEPVFRALGPKMAWLGADDRRFAGLGAAVDARWLTD
jgi:pimeloyl-ACP methyl ester carboxylesterase